MYAIYDVKDNEACVGNYDSIKEITEALGLKPNHVHSIVSKKTLHKNRYRIEYIKDDIDDEGELA